MFKNIDTQVQGMKRRQEFCAENMIYAIKEDGLHDMNTVREYFYNALPHIFGSPKSVGGHVKFYGGPVWGTT